MPHNIIDYREFKLLDELARRFPLSEPAKFAVGFSGKALGLGGALKWGAQNERVDLVPI